MGQAQRLAVDRESEGPARRQRGRRLDGPCFIEPQLDIGLGQGGKAEAAGDQLARPDGIVGAAGNEFGLGRAIGGERQFEGEARGRIECPKFALVIELAPAQRLAPRRIGERTLAEETGA